MIKIKDSKKQKKDAIIALVMFALVIGGSFALFGILKLSLNTDEPLVVVISESMVPTINKGDLLVIQGKNASEIENGTIILYDSRGLWPDDYVPEPIVHRVVGRYYNNSDEKWYFYTLGDNNEGNIDPPDYFNVTIIPVPEDRVIGIVKTIIPKIGFVKIWMDNLNDVIPGMPIIFLVGLSIILLFSIIWDLNHPEEDKKEEKDKEFENEANIESDEKPEVNLGI